VNKIAIIPTLLTLGNAICGFAAIAYAGKIDHVDATQPNEFYMALSGWLIVAAMIFDSLDGYVARITRSASKFGMELDSLCDAISFGAAPAFLLLRLGPGWENRLLHQTLLVVATLYMVCTILRLARYNVVETADQGGGGKKFRGLPSPAAAGCIASLAVLRGGVTQRWPEVDPGMLRQVIEAWATLGAFVVALLMVSRVPYPHMTKQILRGRRHFDHLVVLVVVVGVIALIQEFALAVIFWGYVVVVLGQAVWVRVRHREFAVSSEQ
jgi:CDP-diacylglycerol--serine O-phosphatidyltransferase